MKAKDLKSKLTEEQIIKLMEHFGADHLPYNDNSNEILFRTICHCGDSHKLYYYRDSKEFHCYSNCAQLDIINIAESVLDTDIVDAIRYICNFVGISNNSMDNFEGFSDEIIYNNEDWEILNRFKNDKKQQDTSRSFKILDGSILNRFHKMYHPCFYNDGISIETLNKFGCRYDILNRRIIIPHYDEDGNLIAIRCRNLSEEMLSQGKKYSPIVIDGKLLSAPTGKYLFGLNLNKENIKRAKKIILVEAEKSVMQLDGILEYNISAALSSSSISIFQVELIRSLGVEEVIIALDKEFEHYGSAEEKAYAIKIRKAIISKLIQYFNVSIIWDKNNLLKLKQSPCDCGAEVFWKLLNERIIVR